MSVISFRGFHLVNGAVTPNDCLYAMLPPFWGWVVPSKAVIDSFYTNAAFIVSMETDAAFKIKNPVFDAAFISEKVN